MPIHPAIYDVAIVGYGPSGMLAAILLGRAGHRVAVIERYTCLYNLPRVGIVHDDILRMFQEIGIAERVAPATRFLPNYELAHDGRVLLSNDVEPYATHGWPEFTSIYQPAFETELDVEARRLPNIDLHLGATATAITQTAETVRITVEQDGAARDIEARFLIGADGGNSFVRQTLGIGWEDLGFDQDWLVIDAKAKSGRPGLPHLRQFCDPQQPGMTMQMGPQHRRWSFMIFPGESHTEAMKPENVWRRLDRREGATPDEFDLIRIASYQFQSRIATRWQEGRIFMVGDAVHLMPPFLAQGLCSGFRDSFNLSWKLDLALRDLAPDSFLENYVHEREPPARATVIESMKVGFNVNERDPDKIRARDAQLMALQAQKDAGTFDKALIAFRVPGYSSGVIAAKHRDTLGRGDAFPQGRVRIGGREGLFDDVAGRGFLIITRCAAASSVLSEADQEFWQSLGGRTLEMACAHNAGPTQCVDLDGRILRLMDEYGADVLVKRPDYYLFGAGRRLADLPRLMEDLRESLRTKM
ncbi:MULTISPECIES: bifunctional 3-(3-hydroxy-phenyl)propionate/3-hydroxycinnamic acid hydroxylase [unclassified Beijerinckia]|uniref:bifunctional 3-(3-hydroxy-phenyl)propionate/3-hydroxycinnamic acid hydroxylase n=1 Tax=unclassified Beijerinckia TaxID=2638183 RepID=UPI000898EFFD|nr:MULTISPECIES: bifunctional 3-(3-hydroxy-phenyl)propionate/3-hydroxycinnamic acid hydroxylase [unclassified Beijerinckia]MDH7794997.1 2-polyprenyl-6-methoxyphenol hydroxylase-like FAD-dependent oxidoreductase [Beijerinckia sp. GAS462]SEB83426.1 3-(3-hydroxy-phenyl)propionate hydroxylase/flavoprotein hydroxylase [Beijerinckia sp. 28-YEA-48]